MSVFLIDIENTYCEIGPPISIVPFSFVSTGYLANRVNWREYYLGWFSMIRLYKAVVTLCLSEVFPVEATEGRFL